jgi:hypothetical protein
METIGVAILAAAGDPLAACLDSISGQVDEILVFTWDEEQIVTAKQYQADVLSLTPVNHVELVRQKMQMALSTDWVLILDPDEVVEPRGLEFFRSKVLTADPNVVGFWIPYRMLFFGEELKHSYPDIKQLRLFRRNRVLYTSGIHHSPNPLDGHYEYLNNADPGIEHRFVINLRQRFERHLQWAEVEAAELYSAGQQIADPVALLRAGLEEFKTYTVDRRGMRDGYKGLINALMHSWKSIATLCFLWELQNSPNLQIESPQYWEELFVHLNLPEA